MTNASSATPEFSLWLAVFGLVFLCFFLASIATWTWFFVHAKQIRAWPGWLWDQPQSRVGLIDLIGFFCCLLISQFVAIVAIRPFIGRGPYAIPELSIPQQDAMDAVQASKSLDMPAWLTPALALSYLLAVALSVGLLSYRTGASLRQLGIAGKERSRDLQVGFLLFLMVTPVILIFSGLVNSLTNVEYQHPVIESMREHPWTFPFLFVGAVFCAPLWEEYAFRGLLIRWLDSIRSSGGDLRAIVLGRNNTPQVASLDPGLTPGLEAFAPEHDAAGENPYHPPTMQLATQSDTPAPTPSCPVVAAYPPWWPAIVSGVAFGLAHFAYGISWVPLIVFGTILGRLFQLRRSILPCVVVHACFNGLSMIGLAAQIFSGK